MVDIVVVVTVMVKFRMLMTHKIILDLLNYQALIRISSDVDFPLFYCLYVCNKR